MGGFTKAKSHLHMQMGFGFSAGTADAVPEAFVALSRAMEYRQIWNGLLACLQSVDKLLLLIYNGIQQQYAGIFLKYRKFAFHCNDGIIGTNRFGYGL